MKNKKASTSISIVIFTLAVIVLIGFCLGSFLVNKGRVKERVYAWNFEDIYVMEERINFYLSSGGSLKDVTYFASNDMTIKVEGEEIILEKQYEDMKVSYRFKSK